VVPENKNPVAIIIYGVFYLQKTIPQYISSSAVRKELQLTLTLQLATMQKEVSKFKKDEKGEENEKKIFVRRGFIGYCAGFCYRMRQG